MRVLRKATALVLALSVLCSFCAPIVSAAGSHSDDENEPPVKYQYIQDTRCELIINGSNAGIKSYVYGVNGTVTTCKIELKLQKKVLFWWTTVETWEKTEANYQTSLNVTAPVISGKTYRAVAVVTVWAGSNSESATATSATVEAP